jgi:hypothetical protein
MADTVDVKRLAAWRQRLERFERSGLPVTRFCAAEGVSVASFYVWRKRVAAARTSSPQPQAGTGSGQAFAPVTLLGAGAMTVELPGGTRLQIPAGNVTVLRAALEAIAAADGRRSAGGPSSC